ncbi:hypothetical protein KUL156_54940 [Alteromonas sp. KUL156]|nr:hypothetical protein KUL156_54940 [Alteromonas sp. KUL156]
MVDSLLFTHSLLFSKILDRFISIKYLLEESLAVAYILSITVFEVNKKENLKLSLDSLYNIV